MILVAGQMAEGPSFRPHQPVDGLSGCLPGHPPGRFLILGSLGGSTRDAGYTRALLPWCLPQLSGYGAFVARLQRLRLFGEGRALCQAATAERCGCGGCRDDEPAGVAELDEYEGDERRSDGLLDEVIDVLNRLMSRRPCRFGGAISMERKASPAVLACSATVSAMRAM